jgi:hypothetical protein
MSNLSVAGAMRICAYMTSNNTERMSKLGFTRAAGTAGIGDVYQAQLNGTCYNGSQLREEFKPKVPTLRNFRQNADRFVENGMILVNEARPAGWEADLLDAPETRDYGYLYKTFDEQWDKPFEPPKDWTGGWLGGIGISQSAMKTCVAQYRTQQPYASMSTLALERMIRLNLIREIHSVGEVFLRLGTEPGDIPHYQAAAAEREARQQASETEEAAIADGTAGKGAPKRKAADAASVGNPSKYRNAQDMRLEGQAK